MTKQISVIQFQIGSDCFMRLILLSLIFVDEILSISWLRTPHSALLVQKLSTHDSIGNRFKSFSNFGVYEYNRLSYLSALIVEYDYPDIKYPIPFNELYRNKALRYINYSEPIVGLPPQVLTGEITSFSNHTSDVLMMTGASSNHIFASFNCLYSMVLADPYASYVYLDLGIEAEPLDKLFSHFETIIQIQEKMRSKGVIGYRRLDWDHFPEWFSLFKNPRQRGGYSWKVIPLVDVFLEWKAIVYWIDAGCVIREGISREVTMARHYGLYSPKSRDTVSRWVYPKTQAFLVANHVIPHIVPSETPMVSGGLLIMDYANTALIESFVMPYYKCAYTQKCISPKGSDIGNHRQDQSVLTVMIAGLGIPYSGSPSFVYHPALWQDCKNNETLTTVILNNLFLKIQDTYSIRITNRYYKTSGIRYTREYYRAITRPLDGAWPYICYVC